jgi:zinc D-Ala-D-Ala dipeptidase
MINIKSSLIGLWGLASLPAMAAPLVDVTTLIPDIVLDVRYHGSFNFVGEPIDGYLQPKCLLTEPAAKALQAVQLNAKTQGLTLKIFDCYRPQRAVDHFVRWAKDLDDIRMKQTFYPQVDKSMLFAEGYIAERSGHSRGSTVDLTLATIAEGKARELDMGSHYDFFDPLSHTDNPSVSPEASANRQRLVELMTGQGFKNLPEEWWHYTLVDEPYPDTYFNVPVQ